MQNSSVCLIASILAALTVLITAAYAGRPTDILLATQPAPQTVPQYEQMVELQTQAVRRRPVKLLFIGDSITAIWMKTDVRPWANVKAVWDKWFAPRQAFALGISGDQTQNVLWRLDRGEVAGLHPQLVVVLIGTNNISHGELPNDVTQGIERVIQDLHARLPAAHILVLGIYPRQPDARNDVCAQVNAMLSRDLNTSTFATFLDIGHVLQVDDQPDPNLYMEGSAAQGQALLHPNAFGAERLARAMDPEISRWLKN